jgi:hypothetical protein
MAAVRITFRIVYHHVHTGYKECVIKSGIRHPDISRLIFNEGITFLVHQKPQEIL